MTQRSPWGRHEIPEPGKTERIEVGPLTIWLRGLDSEIWVAYHRGEGGVQRPTAPADDMAWSRWAHSDTPHHLLVAPAFPDRPLVVKPDFPFTLLRKAEARVYSRVPAWVRLQAVEEDTGGRSTLIEIPTQVLSDTWWGDFVDGELAYWLPTKARRQLRPDHFEPHLIVCTLQLTNVSVDDLTVEKLSLRVEHLSIFERTGELWGEEVVVEYHGETEGSEIRMDDMPPREALGAREITPARAQSRGFRVRTFARLRALSGWGA